MYEVRSTLRQETSIIKTKGASILTNTKKDAFYVFIKSKSASLRHALWQSLPLPSYLTSLGVPLVVIPCNVRSCALELRVRPNFGKLRKKFSSREKRDFLVEKFKNVSKQEETKEIDSNIWANVTYATNRESASVMLEDAIIVDARAPLKKKWLFPHRTKLRLNRLLLRYLKNIPRISNVYYVNRTIRSYVTYATILFLCLMFEKRK